MFDLNWYEMVIAMVIAHYWADWSLQTDFVAMGKNRLMPQCNKDIGIPWYHMMIAHCAIHAGVMWLITGSLLICVLEMVSHLIIDCLKCEKKIGIFQDQMLHLAFKAGYVFLIYGVI